MTHNKKTIFPIAKDTLYIIGNGFDLCHGLKTKYSDFYQYILSKNKSILDQLEIVFCSLGSNELLWSDFEKLISSYDSNGLLEGQVDCINDLEYKEKDYEIVNNYVTNALSRFNLPKLIQKELQEYFNSWIESINVSLATSKVKIKTNSLFLSFNYTTTLEDIYKVNRKHICYIHNRVGEDLDLKFGHCWDYGKTQIQNTLHPTEEDIINENINSLLAKLHKNTREIINEHKHLLNKLNDVMHIYVLGHSLSDVDMPYMEEIFKYTNGKNVKWHISCLEKHYKDWEYNGDYYDEKSKSNVMEFKDKIGILDDNFEIINIVDLKSYISTE